MSAPTEDEDVVGPLRLRPVVARTASVRASPRQVPTPPPLASPLPRVDGRENVWPASVSVDDALSGEIQVVYGSISRDSWITFPAWP